MIPLTWPLLGGLAWLLYLLVWPLRVQLLAAWRATRDAVVALALAALLLGYLSGSTPPEQPAAITCQPCPPCAALPATPRPHEVDHAPYYIVDPLAPYTAPDLGSAVPAGDVDARVRALDERARQRGR